VRDGVAEANKYLAEKPHEIQAVSNHAQPLAGAEAKYTYLCTSAHAGLWCSSRLVPAATYLFKHNGAAMTMAL
jgi:hypothetical protein